MSFLSRMAGVTFCDRVMSLTVQKSHGLWGRPRTSWRDLISCSASEHLGIPEEELESLARDREVWAEPLTLLPQGKDGRKMNSEINKCL